MKIKFNKFERVAGLFVMTAIVGSLATAVAVAVKRGWFENKVMLETTLASADGVHVGTGVTMAGLRAGSVDAVELKSNNEILVRFEISQKFHERVREDSVVRVMRPFVIGEKVLDISVGTEALPVVAEHTVLKSEETMDIMDLMNGQKLGKYMASMSKMTENLKIVAEAFVDPERIRTIVKIFDQMNPLVTGMTSMSKEVTGLIKSVNKKDQVSKALTNLVTLTDEVNRILPALKEDAPQMAADFKTISRNMAVLTDEMRKVLPVVQGMAPEFPRVSRRAIEALDETVVVLKALQKSFILRSNARDVREEEAKAAASKPAATEPAAGRSDDAADAARTPASN